ncbi:MAG: type II toxin-antitoxin system RelE/ParE family toxin [Cruoricaptor ignavus]|nr:type II toxin-antitoxin system RelE/ParE family toxin [Cruoricaptor ignavus]
MWNINWSPEAESQYYHILEYWNNRNKSNIYSLKIIDEVERMEELLSYNPFIGQECFLDAKTSGIRRVIVLSNYSIIYRISENIDILSFWDNRLDPKKLTL